MVNCYTDNIKDFTNIEVPVPSQKSEGSCLLFCILEESMYVTSVSTFFRWNLYANCSGIDNISMALTC